MTPLMAIVTNLCVFAQGAGRPGQQGDPAAAMASMGVCMACVFIPTFLFVIVIIVSLWKIFTKAGQPGWASIIPIYNTYVMTIEIAKMEMLWFILMFIPLANIVASWMLCMEIARKFRKSEGFGIGLFFLPFIFFPILGFGDARYSGRKQQRRDDYGDEYE